MRSHSAEKVHHAWLFASLQNQLPPEKPVELEGNKAKIYTSEGKVNKFKLFATADNLLRPIYNN